MTEKENENTEEEHAVIVEHEVVHERDEDWQPPNNQDAESKVNTSPEAEAEQLWILRHLNIKTVL